MITVKKNVYYCSHCNKRSLSAGHMRNHESTCTANPNRYCKLCETKSVSELIDGFKKRFELVPFMVENDEGDRLGDDFGVKWIGEPVTMKELRDSVDNCPNCLFAIIRQCKFNYHYFKEEFKFDYVKELKSVLDDRNDKLARQEAYGLI